MSGGGKLGGGCAFAGRLQLWDGSCARRDASAVAPCMLLCMAVMAAIVLQLVACSWPGCGGTVFIVLLRKLLLGHSFLSCGRSRCEGGDLALGVELQICCVLAYCVQVGLQ